MGDGSVLKPEGLVLPSITGANLAPTSEIGSVFISGGKIVFWTGAAWQTVTST